MVCYYLTTPRGETDPILWQASWCFYNSSAFKAAASISLLGAFAVIVPALLNLPRSRTAPAGQAQAPIVKFNRARRATYIWGFIALIASVIPLVLYFIVLVGVEGETCNVNATMAGGVKLILVLLYLATVIVLAVFAWFYIKSRFTLRLEEELPEQT